MRFVLLLATSAVVAGCATVVPDAPLVFRDDFLEFFAHAPSRAADVCLFEGVAIYRGVDRASEKLVVIGNGCDGRPGAGQPINVERDVDLTVDEYVELFELIRAARANCLRPRAGAPAFVMSCFPPNIPMRIRRQGSDFVLRERGSDDIVGEEWLVVRRDGYLHFVVSRPLTL
jgi:hypothetical protein